jgi:hypothetical protein
VLKGFGPCGEGLGVPLYFCWKTLRKFHGLWDWSFGYGSCDSLMVVQTIPITICCHTSN